MPPARRRNRNTEAAEAATTEATEATTTETTEAEATEDTEDKPKRTRVAKTYKVVDAELANELAGNDGDEISEGDPATGEMISQMRDNKAKWDGEQDVNPGIKWVFGSNTAIPFRNMLNKFLAEQDEDNSLSLDDPDAIYEALISGEGWVTLAARTGASINDVKEAVKDIVAENHDGADVMNGRAYGKGDNWTWVSGEALVAAKNAANGDDEEEGDEDEADTESDEDTDEVEADATPAPTPRRRPKPATTA